MYETILAVNAGIANSIFLLLGLSYIENHIRVHEYNVKHHDPHPRINNQPL